MCRSRYHTTHTNWGYLATITYLKINNKCHICTFINVTKVHKTNSESRDKLIVRCYIKKTQSLQVVSNRLVKLTSLIRFLKMSNDSDNRIDLSSLDQMQGLNKSGNSPKSRNRISRMILRTSTLSFLNKNKLNTNIEPEIARKIRTI